MLEKVFKTKKKNIQSQELTNGSSNKAGEPNTSKAVIKMRFWPQNFANACCAK